MRIELSDPGLVPSMLVFLHGHVHVNAEQVGEREIEVSQLGSMNFAARRFELDLLLQVWRASHEQASVAIVE